MTSRSRPWPPGSVTAIGSLPGVDPTEAAALVVGELPGFPHLVELPQRGPGADMIGRSAGLLVDLPVELTPSGWRLTSHEGRDVRRAHDFLAWDVDALEVAANGLSGPVKAQATGPWTLAANLELPNGHKVVSDEGATRDLIASLTEGIAAHLAEIAARVPGARPVLQLDEPSMPAVLGGRVATPSGYGTVRAVAADVVERGLATVLAAAPDGARAVHCCAADVPIALMRRSGANALSLDAAGLSAAQYDVLGEAVDDGASLWLGVLPAVQSSASLTLDTGRDHIDRIWSQLGFAPQLLAEAVVPTPSCGLAGASLERVRRVLSLLRDLGKDLLDRQ